MTYHKVTVNSINYQYNQFTSTMIKTLSILSNKILKKLLLSKGNNCGSNVKNVSECTALLNDYVFK